jgi:hypothetical protein
MMLYDHNLAAWARAANTPHTQGREADAEGHDEDEDDPQALEREEADELLDRRADVVFAGTPPIAHLAHALGAIAVGARVDDLAEVQQADGSHYAFALDISRPGELRLVCSPGGDW